MREYGGGRGGEKRRAGIGKQKIDTAWIDCRKLSATTQATAVTLLVRCTTQHKSHSSSKLSRVTIARSAPRPADGGTGCRMLGEDKYIF